jgi:hypothetical protein
MARIVAREQGQSKDLILGPADVVPHPWPFPSRTLDFLSSYSQLLILHILSENHRWLPWLEPGLNKVHDHDATLKADRHDL